MPYAPLTWVEGVTTLGPTNLNHLETGVDDAHTIADAAIPAPAPITSGPVYWNGSAWVSAKLTHAQLDAAAGITYGQLNLATGDIPVAKLAVDNILPWLIDVDVFPTPISQTNFDTIALPAGNPLYYGHKASSGAQNAEINWDLVLAAGTWTVELIHHTFTDVGIYTVQFDAVTKGTIDGYSGGDVVNVRSSVTGIVVAATGKVRLKLLMATKNASSSSYTGRIQHVQLRRTA